MAGLGPATHVFSLANQNRRARRPRHDANYADQSMIALSGQRFVGVRRVSLASAKLTETLVSQADRNDRRTF
jgi:hypothetical protein